MRDLGVESWLPPWYPLWSLESSDILFGVWNLLGVSTGDLLLFPLDFFLEFIGPIPCQTSVLKAGHGFGILFGGWNLFGLSTGDLLLWHPLWSLESLWG